MSGSIVKIFIGGWIERSWGIAEVESFIIFILLDSIADSIVGTIFFTSLTASLWNFATSSSSSSSDVFFWSTYAFWMFLGFTTSLIFLLDSIGSILII